MKNLVAGAIALTFASAQLCAMPAYAAQPAGAFRTVEAQKFSSADLERYGLDKAAATRGEKLQSQGYQIKVLSQEEAAQYKAGITDNQWIMLGILAGVIVIAVAVAD